MHIFLQSSKYLVCRAQELGSMETKVCFNPEYLCFRQGTLVLPCNPNSAFVYDLQTTVGLYNYAVLILSIPNTLRRLIMCELHPLFMPDLFHIYSSALKLEIDSFWTA